MKPPRPGGKAGTEGGGAVSYDLCLHSKPCEHCGNPSQELWRTNCTFNVGVVFWDSIARKENEPERPKGEPSFGSFWRLRGLTQQEADVILSEAIEYAEAHRHDWSEPSNGWGSIQGAIDTMRRLREAWADHPKAVFSVWC